MPEPQNRPKTDAPAAGKKPYRAPRLTVYGDLRTITKAKGGTNNDGGGQPRTKK